MSGYEVGSGHAFYDLADFEKEFGVKPLTVPGLTMTTLEDETGHQMTGILIKKPGPLTVTAFSRKFTCVREITSSTSSHLRSNHGFEVYNTLRGQQAQERKSIFTAPTLEAVKAKVNLVTRVSTPGAVSDAPHGEAAEEQDYELVVADSGNANPWQTASIPPVKRRRGGRNSSLVTPKKSDNASCNGSGNRGKRAREDDNDEPEVISLTKGNLDLMSQIAKYTSELNVEAILEGKPCKMEIYQATRLEKALNKAGIKDQAVILNRVIRLASVAVLLTPASLVGVEYSDELAARVATLAKAGHDLPPPVRLALCECRVKSCMNQDPVDMDKLLHILVEKPDSEYDPLNQQILANGGPAKQTVIVLHKVLMNEVILPLLVQDPEDENRVTQNQQVLDICTAIARKVVTTNSSTGSGVEEEEQVLTDGLNEVLTVCRCFQCLLHPLPFKEGATVQHVKAVCEAAAPTDSADASFLFVVRSVLEQNQVYAGLLDDYLKWTIVERLMGQNMHKLFDDLAKGDVNAMDGLRKYYQKLKKNLRRDSIDELHMAVVKYVTEKGKLLAEMCAEVPPCLEDLELFTGEIKDMLRTVDEAFGEEEAKYNVQKTLIQANLTKVDGLAVISIVMNRCDAIVERRMPSEVIGQYVELKVAMETLTEGVIGHNAGLKDKLENAYVVIVELISEEASKPLALPGEHVHVMFEVAFDLYARLSEHNIQSLLEKRPVIPHVNGLQFIAAGVSLKRDLETFKRLGDDVADRTRLDSAVDHQHSCALRKSVQKFQNHLDRGNEGQDFGSETPWMATFSDSLTEGRDAINDLEQFECKSALDTLETRLQALKKISRGTKNGEAWSKDLDESSEWDDVIKVAQEVLLKSSGKAIMQEYNLTKEAMTKYVHVHQRHQKDMDRGDEVSAELNHASATACEFMLFSTIVSAKSGNEKKAEIKKQMKDMAMAGVCTELVNPQLIEYCAALV